MPALAACAPQASCRTLPLLARLRLKRPSDARSAERGEGVRATRGARSEVRASSHRDADPGCVCAAGFLPSCRTLPLQARLRLKRPSDARSEVSRGARPSKAQSARAPSEAPMPEHRCARVVFPDTRVWSCALCVCLVSGDLTVCGVRAEAASIAARPKLAEASVRTATVSTRESRHVIR